MGYVLTDLGLISTPILYDALKTQMVHIVADLFPRTTGEWSFEARRIEPMDEPGPHLSMAALMIEGIKAIRDFSFYKNHFSDYLVKPTDTPMESAGELTTVQRKFISKLGRLFPTPNHKMVELMGMSEELYWRATLLFFLLGRLEFIENVEAEVEPDMGDTAIIRLSVVREQIATALASSKHQSDDSPLRLDEGPVDELPPAAPAEEQASKEIILVDEGPKPPAPASIQGNPSLWYEEAEKAFEQHNFMRVMGLMEQAIRVGPARPKFYQLLGRAQMQYPNLRRDAEQSFLKQAEMEPWNADPYYFLGELYQLEGLVIRAEKQFEKALEINLEHTKAGIRMNQINPARMRAAQSQKRKKG
jgi:tetratricopeptide (TPR) repeat protein